MAPLPAECPCRAATVLFDMFVQRHDMSLALNKHGIAATASGHLPPPPLLQRATREHDAQRSARAGSDLLVVVSHFLPVPPPPTGESARGYVRSEESEQTGKARGDAAP